MLTESFSRRPWPAELLHAFVSAADDLALPLDGIGCIHMGTESTRGTRTKTVQVVKNQEQDDKQLLVFNTRTGVVKWKQTEVDNEELTTTRR